MPLINKFLSHENTVRRLLDDYYKHGKLVLLYDFDNTVCTYNPLNPEPTLERQPNHDICGLLQELRPYCTFILWTCRTYDQSDNNGSLHEAVLWLLRNNIPLDYINSTGQDYKGGKIYGNILLDDRAGLASAVMALKSFLANVADPNLI